MPRLPPTRRAWVLFALFSLVLTSLPATGEETTQPITVNVSTSEALDGNGDAVSWAIPCSLVKSQAECEGARGKECKYDEQAGRCRIATRKNTKRVCSDFATKATCEAGGKNCVWSGDDQSCGVRRPNIIFSIGDDIGYFDAGVDPAYLRSSHYTNYHKVPTLTAMRESGVYLQNFYTAKMCAPSRTSLLTGLPYYILGFGDDNDLGPTRGARCALPTSVATMADALRDRGDYSTFAFGKWHLGFMRFANTPVGRGFDTFVGNLGGPLNHLTGMGDECICAKSGLANACSKATYCSSAPAFINISRNGDDAPGGEYTYRPAAGVEDYDHVDLFLVDQVISKIDKSEAIADVVNRPFLLYIAWSSAHVVNKAPARYLNLIPTISPTTSPISQLCGTHAEHGRRQYLAEIALLDHVNTMLIDKLDETNLLDSTVLIFLSDNGGDSFDRNRLPRFPRTKHCTDTTWAFNYPNRGMKHSLWQGGVHTVSWIWSPSQAILPARLRGSVYPELFHISDYFETVMEMANLPSYAPSSPQQEVFGKGHWNAILALGKSSPPRTEIALQLFPEAWGGLRAALVMKNPLGNGDNSIWKLIYGYPGEGPGVGTSPPFLLARDGAKANLDEPVEMRRGDVDANIITANPSYHSCLLNKDGPCLFNLSQDPSERNNLRNAHPDVLAVMLKDLNRNLALQTKYNMRDQFCDAGWFPRPTKMVSDRGVFVKAKECGVFAPWLPNLDDGQEVPCARAVS